MKKAEAAPVVEFFGKFFEEHRLLESAYQKQGAAFVGVERERDEAKQQLAVLQAEDKEVSEMFAALVKEGNELIASSQKLRGNNS